MSSVRMKWYLSSRVVLLVGMAHVIARRYHVGHTDRSLIYVVRAWVVIQTPLECSVGCRGKSFESFWEAVVTALGGRFGAFESLLEFGGLRGAVWGLCRVVGESWAVLGLLRPFEDGLGGFERLSWSGPRSAEMSMQVLDCVSVPLYGCIIVSVTV